MSVDKRAFFNNIGSAILLKKHNISWYNRFDRFDFDKGAVMEKYQYITLREKPDLKIPAAEWFHSKWGVPTAAYLECMDAYLRNETEYGWYLC